MKKIIGVLLALVMVFGVVGVIAACDDGTIEVAMITDSGDITDKSFNQTTWEAVEDYCKTNKVSYKYYKPIDETNQARVEKIEESIGDGAQIVVCPGFLFEVPIYEVQDKYPDVKFVLLDGTPNNDDWSSGMPTYKTAPNTYCILFQEEQAGYLAGYSAVKDGQTNLGFLGGIAVPAVQRFGYGYVQGINDAAKELNKNVNVWYAYGGQFFGDIAITSVIDAWYVDGINTVFSCGGGIYSSVLDSIAKLTGDKKANAKMIGVDSDQSLTVDGPVLTSAMKGLYEATQTALDIFFAGNWSTIGGKDDTYGLNANDGGKEYVGLPTHKDSWNFETFSLADYNAVVAKIRSGATSIDNNTKTDINAWMTSASNITNKYYNGDIIGSTN